jgi:GT2 family glycosyltransferase
MKLSIIVVSWNVKRYLLGCLRSIKDNPPGCEYEVIVVDNASDDGTVGPLQQQYPFVRLIANKENRGFAGANNQGLDVAAGQYIFFLNPDTVVKPGAVNILLNFMEKNPDVGACGPRLVFEDGRIQRSVRRFPTFTGALHRHTIFKSLGIFKAAHRKWLMRDFSYDVTTEVDQVIGAAMMVRRSVLDKVGYMDEKNFFMYYEEVDLCYRIKQARYRVMFVPDAQIIHLAGRSSGQIPAEKTIMAMNSLLKFFKKHSSPFKAGLFSWLFKSAFVLNEICSLLIYSIVYTFGLACFSPKIRAYSAEKLGYSAKLLRLSQREGLG